MIARLEYKPDRWQRPARYFFAALATLLIGTLVQLIPPLPQTDLAHGISAADLVAFAAEMAALILFFAGVKAGTQAISEDGRGLSFLRGIAVPLATLITVAFAQRLLGSLLVVFLQSAGRTFFATVSIVAVVAAGTWLILAAYRHAHQLLEAFRYLAPRFRQTTAPSPHSHCPACGAFTESAMVFCGSCGSSLKAMECENCHALLQPAQRFCTQCGKPVGKY